MGAIVEGVWEVADGSSETLPLLAPVMAVLTIVFSQVEVGWLWYYVTDQEKKLAFTDLLKIKQKYKL